MTIRMRDSSKRPHYVYRCYDKTGRLIYVGCSVEPATRVAGHKKNAWWGDEIAAVRFTVFPDREYAHAKERLAIYTERPRYNIKCRWHVLDPRDDWGAQDYVDYHESVRRGMYNGDVKAKLLREIEVELNRRFGVTVISAAVA